MPKSKTLTDATGEVRELTATDMRRFRPAKEVLTDTFLVKLDAVQETGKGLETAANEVLRIGLGMTTKPVAPPFRIQAFVDGLQPGLDPDKMNQLLDELEAGELARRHSG